MRKAVRNLLSFLVVAGVLLRVAAVFENEHPHGDVHLDLLTLHSLSSGEGFVTPLERSLAFYPESETAGGTGGYPSDQHPPLSVLIALPLVPLCGSDTYLALQLASLLEGILLLGAVYLLTRRLFSANEALIACALVSTSFVLMDFAGNGSLYTLQALLAVLTVLALSRGGVVGAVGAGIGCGLLYLDNYQALAYLPAVLLAVLLAGTPTGFSGRTVFRLLLVVSAFAVVCLPWWIRNFEVFGDPLFSVNPFYLQWRLGAAMGVGEGPTGPLLVMSGPDATTLVKNLVMNILVNLRFVSLQAPLWLATVLPAAVLGFFTVFRTARKERSAAPMALCLILLAHLATMIFWPACKFRYLVPLVVLAVPLAVRATGAIASKLGQRIAWLMVVGLFLMAAERLLRGPAQDGAILMAATGILVVPVLMLARAQPVPRGILLGGFLLSQVLLFFSADTRTTYYDGILVSDAQGNVGQEKKDRDTQEALKLWAERLNELGVTAVVARIDLKSYTLPFEARIRVIQPLPIGSEQGLSAERRVEVYRSLGATHVLAAAGGEESEFLELEGVHLVERGICKEDSFSLLALP